MNDSSEISIRRAESQGDYRACQEAQRLAWGIVDDGYLVPIATMVGAQLHGGLVLGAFLNDGRAVGLSFAFLGRSEGELCLYSQLTGIVPDYQAQGLGQRFKTAQREFAQAEAIPTIAWAFDPLQAGNARFNLDKLGATSNRYMIDMYGPRSDALNRNTPTDRLIVHWTTSPEASKAQPLEGQELKAAIRIVDPTAPKFVGLPSAKPAILLLEIPADIKALRAEHSQLADRWIIAVRTAFNEAFGLGYRAVGFHRDDSREERRCFYILRLDLQRSI